MTFTHTEQNFPGVKNIRPRIGTLTEFKEKANNYYKLSHNYFFTFDTSVVAQHVLCEDLEIDFQDQFL